MDFVEPVNDPVSQAGNASDIDPSSRQLIEAESRRIKVRRCSHGFGATEEDISAEHAVGVAFSGGGIRSATFALGVTQALARRDLLRYVDYLSTVSGGGYLGSSLTWWWSGRASEEPGIKFGVGAKDFPYGADSPTEWRGRAGTTPGPRILTHLRRHGNYLTPGGGITRASLVAVVLRGILLNLVVWLPLITGLMYLLLWLLPERSFGQPFWTVTLMGCSLGLPFGLGMMAFSWSRASELPLATPIARLLGRPVWFWALTAVLWLCFLLYGLTNTGSFDQSPFAVDRDLGLGVPLAGALAVASIVLSIMYSLSSAVPVMRPIGYDFRRLLEAWAGTFLVLLGIFLVIGSLPILTEGVIGSSKTLAAAWPTLAGGAAVSTTGIIVSLVTFVRERARALLRQMTKGGSEPRPILAIVGAALILYGVAMITFVAASLFDSGALSASWLLAAVGAATTIALFCNINHVSFHRFYRDRLMEAFMPSYDQVKMERTGRAPTAADEMWLHNETEGGKTAPIQIINTNLVLVDATDRQRRLRGGDSFILTQDYCGSNTTGWCPTFRFMNGRMTLATAMAISGAAANPNTGSGGAGLTRNRAISTLMSLLNLRLGYWVHHPKRADSKSDKSLDGLSTKIAMTCPPNHFFPGVWGTLPFRAHREDAPYLELSDGGHFENLGLYELVRRRCKLIIVCDGACDPNYTFADLQIALRRVGTDFGAEIHFENNDDLTPVISRERETYPKGAEIAKQGHLIGTIAYADGSKGELIYLKTTMVPYAPLAVRGYKGANHDFPDQTTADQFFDEDQFEAYRELGFQIADRMMDGAKLDERLESIAANWGASPSRPEDRL